MFHKIICETLERHLKCVFVKAGASSEAARDVALCTRLRWKLPLLGIKMRKKYSYAVAELSNIPMMLNAHSFQTLEIEYS